MCSDSTAPGSRKTNLAAVAREAGVHASTVSRVLNPATRAMVSDTVAKKIEAVANRLGYRPNAVAASLRRGQSMTIGVVLPDITNPVFPPMLAGIEAALEAEGYVAIVANAGDDATRQARIIERLAARQVDGMILATATRTGAVLPRTPVVLINRTETCAILPSVVSDDRLGMSLAVHHLAALGHTRIAHLGGPLALSTGHGRLSGFLQAMHEAGLRPEGVVHAGAYTRAAGHEACLRLLAGTLPTAIVAANDLLALGCYEAMAEHGLACPDDISVTGHNDMDFVDLVSPKLTTVRIRHRDMGLEAARLLLRAMRGEAIGQMELVLRPEFIVRASTGNPPPLL